MVVLRSTAIVPRFTYAAAMRIPTALVAVALVTSVAAGCSSDDGEVSKTEPTKTPSATAPASPAPEPADSGAELKAAVKSYSDAFLTGDDATAFGLLSKRCQKRTDKKEFETVVAAANLTYGTALPFTAYKADVSEGMARVTYAYSKPEINQDSEPWVNEGGWKQDDC